MVTDKGQSTFLIFFKMKSSDDGRDEFSGVDIKIVRDPVFRMAVRSSFHQSGTVNENVLESDFVPL